MKAQAEKSTTEMLLTLKRKLVWKKDILVVCQNYEKLTPWLYKPRLFHTGSILSQNYEKNYKIWYNMSKLWLNKSNN